MRTDAVVQWLNGAGSAGQSVVGEIAAHGDAIERAVEGLFALGLILAALNLWRAVSFAVTLSRGIRFLNIDLRARRRDLDDTIKRLSNRVATISAEVEINRVACGRGGEAREHGAHQ